MSRQAFLLCLAACGGDDGGGIALVDAPPADSFVLPENISRCLGKTPTTAADPITFLVQPRTLPGQVPLDGVTVELYSQSDNSMLASGVSAPPDNVVQLSVPSGGMPLDIRLHHSRPGYISGNAFLPDLADRTVRYYPDTSTEQDDATNYQANGVTRDPTKGFFAFVAFDCDFRPIVGAHVTTEPPVTIKYPNGATATSTGQYGYGMAFNVPAGPLTVDSWYGEQELHSYQVTMYPNEYSFAVLLP